MQSLVCWFYSTVTLSSYQLTCVIFICSADPTSTSQGVKNFARRLSHRKFALAKANFEKPVLKSPYNGILNPISPFDSGKFSCFTSSSTRHHGKPSLTAPHQSENVFAHGRQFFFLPHPPPYLSTDEKHMVTKELKVRKPKYVLLQAIVMHRFGSKHCILNVLHWELE